MSALAESGLTAAALLARMTAGERASLLAEATRLIEAELVIANPRLWMYVVRAGYDGPVKVGISRDPQRRLRELQRSNPDELRLLLTWRALLVEERGFHEEYADLRLHGEWFRPHPELLRHARNYVAAREHLG